MDELDPNTFGFYKSNIFQVHKRRRSERSSYSFTRKRIDGLKDARRWSNCRTTNDDDGGTGTTDESEVKNVYYIIVRSMTTSCIMTYSKWRHGVWMKYGVLVDVRRSSWRAVNDALVDVLDHTLKRCTLTALYVEIISSSVDWYLTLCTSVIKDVKSEIKSDMIGNFIQTMCEEQQEEKMDSDRQQMNDKWLVTVWCVCACVIFVVARCLRTSWDFLYKSWFLNWRHF